MFWLIMLIIIVVMLTRMSARSERARMEGRPDEVSSTTRLALWAALVLIASRLMRRSGRD